MKKITTLFALLYLVFYAENLQGQNFTENAKAELAKNNFRPAIEELTSMLTANPNDEMALTYRANFYNRIGEQEKSLTDAGKALSLNPKNMNALIVSGSAKVAQEKFNEAIVDFTKALTLKPNLKPALMLRAQTYFKMQDSKKALGDLDFAIKDDPKNLEAYLYRGRINFDQNKFAEAAADYTFIKNNSQTGSRFYDLAAKELVVTNAKIDGNNSKNGDSKEKIEQEVQAKKDDYLKKMGDDMKSMSKELNDATTRLKPLSDSQTQLTNEFTAKLKVLPKNDYQAIAALYKEMNPRMAAMVLTYEKEIAKLKGNENLRPLEKSMTEVVKSTKILIDRTRPYAARHFQYITQYNALNIVVEKDVNKFISDYNIKDTTNYVSNKKAAVSSLEKVILLLTDTKSDLSKYNDNQYKAKDEAEINSFLQAYTQQLAQIKAI